MPAKTNRRKAPKREPGEKESPPFTAAVEAVAEGQSRGLKDVVTLQNGVVLAVKSVPPLLIRKAVGKIKRPVVPKADVGKGREEENPGDPEYSAAMDEYAQQTFDAGANVMLAAGTKLLSVPEGIDKPEDASWLEVLEAAGFEPDLKNATSRYLSWLSYYAITSERDVVDVVMAVTKLSGVPESEVAKAVETFRSGEARGADNGVPAEDS